MPLDHGVYQPFTVGLAGHVAGHHVGLGNLGLQRPQALGPPRRQNRDRSAGGQRMGQLLAQAGTRAGDHDNPPGQAVGRQSSISIPSDFSSIIVVWRVTWQCRGRRSEEGWLEVCVAGRVMTRAADEGTIVAIGQVR